MTMIVRVAALSAFVASYASGLTLGTSDYFSLDCDGYDSIGLCSEAFMEQCRAAKGENPGCVGAMCSGKETCTDICGCNGRKCIYFSPPTTKSPVYEEAVEAPTTSAPTKAPTCPAGTYGTIPAGPFVDEFYDPVLVPKDTDFDNEAFCPGGGLMCKYVMTSGPEAGSVVGHIPAEGLSGASFTCVMGDSDTSTVITLDPRTPSIGAPTEFTLNSGSDYTIRVVAGVTSMNKLVTIYSVLGDGSLGSSNKFTLVNTESGEVFTKLHVCMEPMGVGCRPLDPPVLPKPTPCPAGTYGHINAPLEEEFFTPEHVPAVSEFASTCPGDGVMCAFQGLMGLLDYIPGEALNGESFTCIMGAGETTSITLSPRSPVSGSPTSFTLNSGNNYTMRVVAGVTDKSKVLTVYAVRDDGKLGSSNVVTLSNTEEGEVFIRLHVCVEPMGVGCRPKEIPPLLGGLSTPTLSPTKEPCPAGTHGVIVGTSGIDGDASDPLKFPRVEEFYVPSVVPDDVTFAAMCPGEGGSEMCKYKDMMGTLYDYIPEEGLQGDSFTCLLSNGSVEISLVPRDPITEGPPVSLQLGSTDLYSMRVVAGVTSMSKVIYSYAVLFEDPLALGSSNVFPMSTVDTDEVFIKLHICIEPMKDACRPKNVPVLPLGPASSPTKAPTGQPSPAPTDPCPAGTYGVLAGVNDANNGDASGFPTVEDFYTQENLLNSFQVLVASPDGFCPEKGEMCKFNMDDFIPDSALSGTSFNCTLEDGKEVKISLSNKDPTDTSPYSGITLYSGLEHSFSLVSCLRSDAMVSYSYHVAFETSGEDLRPYAFGASDYATCTVESVAGETRATIVGLYVCVEPMGHACRHEHNEYIPNQLPYLKGPMHSPTMAPVPTTAAPHPLSAEVVTTPQPTSGPTEEYCKCADKSVNIEGAGKVTGGGWIYLTGTSYLNCQLAAGNPTGNKALDCGLLDTTINPSALNQIRVNYGFVGMYRKGIPMGSTNFDLEGGNFHFHSDMRNTPYKFLEVLEDGIHARWMGQGALSVKARTQGKGGWEYGYCFMVAVHDNGEPGYLDTFRLRVWDCSGKTKLSQCTLSDPLSSSVSLHTFASVGDRPECLVFDTNSDFPVPSLDTDNAVPSQTINLERFNGTEVGELGEQHGGGNIQIHLKSKKNVYMDYMRQSGMPCTACEGFEEELAISDNGFVTGGGWILLDEQAYLKPATCTCLSQGKPSRADRFLDQDLKIVGDGTGICDSPDLGLAKANYGFNAKHINGVPQGSFNFDINGNGFHFHSDAIFDNNSEFDCLEVVCDDRYSSSYMEVVARWTGIGKIARTMEPPQDNSRSWVPGYRFWISVQDNGEPGFLDTIRIRIEDKDCPGTILFDTDFNSGVIFTGAEPKASLCPTYSDKDNGPIADPFCEVAGNVCSDADYQGTSLVGQWNGTQAGLEDLVKKGGGNIQMHCKGGPSRA